MSDTSSLGTVWHQGKAYRRGYTTGSCATAAAKVASLMVLRQHLIHQVSIVTPSGVALCLNVEQPLIDGQQATAAIRKDGGDDVDATHGMLICARVTLHDLSDPVIEIVGGTGVGTVTLPGIGLPIGSAAINRTPRQTIEAAVRDVIGPQRGARVEIFAPEGEVRAQKTYNGRLGIVGGISIIGTSGIVTPMSEESWKRSLALELEMKRAAGEDRIILVPGNHGERFVRECLGVDSQRVVTMSNFVGYMVQEAVRLQFRHIVLIGHLGKLIKVAAGIFHTHSHIADGRMETLIANLALMGAPQSLLVAVDHCVTTEAAMTLIAEQGWQGVYPRIATRICERLNELLRFCDHPPRWCVDAPDLVPFDGSFRHSVAQAFAAYDALVVIGALGITVRTLAPLLHDKLCDPAVVVIDEQGQHVISVLSGHVGGANALTRHLAELLGADPVITTATDVNQVAALDLLAQTLDARVQDFRGAVKTINQMLVSGQRVGLWWDDVMLAEQPQCDTRGFILVTSLHDLPVLDALVCVTPYDRLPAALPATLLHYALVPRRVVAGIGCRRDTPQETLQALLARQLAQHHLDPLALCALGSIDVKRDEVELLALAAHWQVPLTWFSAQTLRPAAARFAGSSFVEQTVGVGCVSQPVAWLMSEGHLLGDTLREQGVTLTLGMLPSRQLEPVSGESPLC